MNMDEIVCDCLNITKGMIKDAVYNGATTLEEIQEKTEVGTVCGACNDHIQNLLDFFMKERTS